MGSIHRLRLGLVEVYTASTVLVLLAFPGNLSRLWIPIVPILIAYVLVAARALGRRRYVRIGLSIYFVAFAAVGAANLADSVRLSLSGPQFPDRLDECAFSTGRLQSCVRSSSPSLCRHDQPRCASRVA